MTLYKATHASNEDMEINELRSQQAIQMKIQPSSSNETGGRSKVLIFYESV
jgi:hypothetical protein